MIISDERSAPEKSTPLNTLPLVLILIGPPGAGKGTHSPYLSDYLQIPHISTGDLFRDHSRRQTDIGQQVKSLIDDGKLVPDRIVSEMVFQRIFMQDCQNGVLLDGFPRTSAQAQALDHKIQETHRLLVIQLNVSSSILIERISRRLSCKCGRSYNKTYDPPQKENECNSCHGVLYQRSDDTKEIFQKRLEIYVQETTPVIEHYRKQQNLFEVDGNLSKEEVLSQILKRLK